MKIKSNRLAERYGIANTSIAALCVICLIINSIIVSEAALAQIAPGKFAAYLLNFLAGCEGKLGVIGSMSPTKVFRDGEWWRLIFHMYLHAGVLHMAFNVFALLFAGKVVEKKIGSLQYLLLYHGIAVVNALAMCVIFPNSVSVGASAGIFGMIGIVCVLRRKNDPVCLEVLKRKEILYILSFAALSLLLGFESLITHLAAFTLGIMAGLLHPRVR